MGIQGISSLMGSIKKKYDKSKDRSDWRVMQGMSREYYDTFIAGDNNLWQIKSEEVGNGESVAVGKRISRTDDDIEKIMKNGSPVPFGTVTPQDQKVSIIMSGVQMYSSDSSNLLRKEYLSGSQVALEQRLKNQVEKMKDDPGFRKKYNEQKDRIRRAYI